MLHSASDSWSVTKALILKLTITNFFPDPGEFVCEPDEYSQLVQELKKSGLIKDHRKGLKTIKKSFCGKEFVDWIVRTKDLGMLHFVN